MQRLRADGVDGIDGCEAGARRGVARPQNSVQQAVELALKLRRQRIAFTQ